MKGKQLIEFVIVLISILSFLAFSFFVLLPTIYPDSNFFNILNDDIDVDVVELDNKDDIDDIDDIDNIITSEVIDEDEIKDEFELITFDETDFDKMLYDAWHYQQEPMIYSYTFDENYNLIENINTYYTGNKSETFTPLTHEEFNDIINLINADIKQRYAKNSTDYSPIYSQGFLDIHYDGFYFIPVESDYLKECFMQVVMCNNLYYITDYNYVLELPQMSNSLSITDDWDDDIYIDIHQFAQENTDYHNKPPYVNLNFFDIDMSNFNSIIKDYKLPDNISVPTKYFFDNFNADLSYNTILMDSILSIDTNTINPTIVEPDDVLFSISQFFSSKGVIPEKDVALVNEIVEIIATPVARAGQTFSKEFGEKIFEEFNHDEELIASVWGSGSTTEENALRFDTEFNEYIINSISEYVTIGESVEVNINDNKVYKTMINVAVPDENSSYNFYLYNVPYTTDSYYYYQVIFKTNDFYDITIENNRQYYVIEKMINTFELNDDTVVLNDDNLSQFITCTFSAFANQEYFNDLLVPYYYDSTKTYKKDFDVILPDTSVDFEFYTDFVAIDSVSDILNTQKIQVNDKEFYITQKTANIVEPDGSITVEPYTIKTQFFDPEYDNYSTEIVTEFIGYNIFISRENIDLIDEILHDIMHSYQVDMSDYIIRNF